MVETVVEAVMAETAVEAVLVVEAVLAEMVAEAVLAETVAEGTIVRSRSCFWGLCLPIPLGSRLARRRCRVVVM